LSLVVVPRAEQVYGLASWSGTESEVELNSGHCEFGIGFELTSIVVGEIVNDFLSKGVTCFSIKSTGDREMISWYRRVDLLVLVLGIFYW